MSTCALDALVDPDAWAAYRSYQAECGHCSREELARLDAFMDARGYEVLEPLIAAGDTAAFVEWFGFPTLRTINKQGARKKRTVFCYPQAQTLCLKLLARQLYRYDAHMSPACYSFRRGLTAKNAWERILAVPDLREKHVLKADIHDYFNSIDVRVLLRELRAVICDDPALLAFLEALLGDERAYVDGQLSTCKRGAMAGVPLSAFMANIYLRSLDELFCAQGTPYFRYSDDILLMADSAAQAALFLQRLEEHVCTKGLRLNREKTRLHAPGEPWDFLGFKHVAGKIDLADAVVMKTKAKIKRKARALYRWRKRKGVDYERAARTMVRVFDRKFYDVTSENRFTWTRWFFPVLTATDGLAQIDECLAYYLRYLKTGRHTKANWRVTHEDLKRLGYTSLVREYHQFRKDGARLREGTYRA